MIAEKPSWIKHGGTKIFSIDIQPGGLRFATGGGDHKVRIWNMKYVGRERRTDASASKLLATLRSHLGAVNCVRWARNGRYIASGSDDHDILIHERNPGSGTMEFGSGEPPNVENWKVTMTLRGHTADVKLKKEKERKGIWYRIQLEDYPGGWIFTPNPVVMDEPGVACRRVYTILSILIGLLMAQHWLVGAWTRRFMFGI